MRPYVTEEEMAASSWMISFSSFVVSSPSPVSIVSFYDIKDQTGMLIKKNRAHLLSDRSNRDIVLSTNTENIMRTFE